MQTTPRMMRRRPAMQSQILVLVFMMNMGFGYWFQKANIPICSDMANKSPHLLRLRPFAAGLSFVK